jgi:hypothetical protein
VRKRAHHGNLNAMAVKSGDTSCPFSFDRGPPYELKTELSKEIICPSEVIDDDSYIIHSFERHPSNLQDVAGFNNATLWKAEAESARGLRDRCRTALITAIRRMIAGLAR